MTTFYSTVLIVQSKNKRSLKRFLETIRNYIDCLKAPELEVNLCVFQNVLSIYIGHNYGGWGAGRKAMYIKDRRDETEHIVQIFKSFYCELWTWHQTIRSMVKEAIFVGEHNELRTDCYIPKMRPSIPLHPHELYEERLAGLTCSNCWLDYDNAEHVWHRCVACNYGECTSCYIESRRLTKVKSIHSFSSLKSRIDFTSAGKAVDWSLLIDHPFGDEGESKTLELAVKEINRYYDDIADNGFRLHKIKWVTERWQKLEQIKKVLVLAEDLSDYIDKYGEEGMVENISGSENHPPPPAGRPLFIDE